MELLVFGDGFFSRSLLQRGAAMRNAVTTTRWALLLAAACAVPAAPGRAQDWPQWRGPKRDGVVHGVKVPETWPKALTPDWHVKVGAGVASPVLVGDSVYVFGRHKGEEM